MYSFALAYPYSYSRCAALVKRLARRKGPEIPEEELQSELPSHPLRSREIIQAETLTKSVVKTSPTTGFLPPKKTQGHRNSRNRKLKEITQNSSKNLRFPAFLDQNLKDTF